MIADFSSAQGDRIQLAMLDANSHTVANDQFSFIGSDAFSGEAGQLRYEVASGSAPVCGDVNGEGVFDFMLCIAGVGTMSVSDFRLGSARHSDWRLNKASGLVEIPAPDRKGLV